ncbi:hypothetical protein HYDPIDRAFT_85219 [Hydnomerulius pinastri MD-312]|nr:hypothetical protein HYDPIDRAFT_85219 [Hydnomerulius pinastri MD-312]
MTSLCFAYYCSGHGYGHATRVSAFARHLRGLEPQPTIHIVSSAPKHVFNDSINLGATYRYAEIDPVIVQPVAYQVDRRKSIDILQSFLSKKDALLEQESQWLLSIGASCVLSDAAFLGCLAAHAASLPSILITNFTFDSVYSYLATSYTDRIRTGHRYMDLFIDEMFPDEPVSSDDILPLVQQIYEGYRCADLLVRLPGFIPIPSFFVSPPLPAPTWTDQETNELLPEVIHHLTESSAQLELHDKIPFSPETTRNTRLPRSVIQAPLLVRGITTSPESVYTPIGRSRFLSSIGVPQHLHDSSQTKILIVSFGGQVFRKPSSSRGSSTGYSTPGTRTPPIRNSVELPRHTVVTTNETSSSPRDILRSRQLPYTNSPSPTSSSPGGSAKLVTPSHLYIPGAPPTTKPDATLVEGDEYAGEVTVLNTEYTTKKGVSCSYFDAVVAELEPQLLPDSSWIAVVCGVSKEQWAEGEADDELPENFFVAPKYVYMPDLTAVADVLLGKLGYGTVSECVDSCTPFVYVSRPLFVEEHGLKLLLSQQGVGVELFRAAYEVGDWASAVEEAWLLGRDANDVNVVDLDDLPDEDKAKVLRRHLVLREERQNRADMSSLASSDHAAGEAEAPSVGSSTPAPPPQRDGSEAFPIPYEAPGADVTHDIYKWHADQRRQAGRARASSFAGSVAPPNPAFQHIHEPGGFRRNYVLLQANEQGVDDRRNTNNFIDFLYIFGQFAGEDLEEDDDTADDEEATEQAGASVASAAADETQPLLKQTGRSLSRSRRRAASIGPHGDATVPQAVLMLLKSFVGTGVLFLGKGFANGGLIFSTITISVVALVSLYSFLLLVKAKFVVSGSFGDIGGVLYGPWMRYAILFSITISQIGFVTAYTIFVAENLQAFVSAITKCATVIPVLYFILIQLVIFLPLALIRNLAKLSTAALIADAFILAGLLYIFGSEMSIIGNRGFAEIQMFNSRDFPLFIGTAVFSFEGVGLVIPITDAMREPRKFPKALTGVMIGTLFLFGGAGALAYLTFGSDVKAVVLVNLDQTNKFTQSVQFLYSVAILLSIPLQFFPAVRILENGLFVRSGKRDQRIKWLKNFFRFGLVMVCTAISWAGAADLDKFVALIGSFACVPLCFVYPAMLHYKACAKTRMEKFADIMLGTFGMAAMVFTTVQTIKVWKVHPFPSYGINPDRVDSSWLYLRLQLRERVRWALSSSERGGTPLVCC